MPGTRARPLRLSGAWGISLALLGSAVLVVHGSTLPASASHTTILRVSVSSDGAQGNSGSYGGSVSTDGRYVASASNASNLVPGDTNGTTDIFVRDTVAGTTTRVSVSSSGQQANGYSTRPTVSADGRYIAFVSYASNLVPGDTNGFPDVFVRDTVAGTTTRVSVSSSGEQGNDQSVITRTDDRVEYPGAPSLSTDGRYVAFQSYASNLVAGDTNSCTGSSYATYTNGRCPDIFVHDRATGTTLKASVNSLGQQTNGVSYDPDISANGRYVAFQSRASNLAAEDADSISDVFLRDLEAATTTIVSVSSAGVKGLGSSSAPSISGDGRYVAFQSWAENLVAGDTVDSRDVFVRDRVTATTTRASVTTSGMQAVRVCPGAICYVYNGWPSLASGGRYVAFPGELPDDSGTLVRGLYLRDFVAGVTTKISVGDWPSLSSTGRFLAFESNASNLVPGDTNGTSDVFLYDRGESAPPTIASFTADPPAFSPNPPSGDGVKDTTTFTASISDESPPISWTLDIKNVAGLVVRSFSGSSTSSPFSIAQPCPPATAGVCWDGKDSNGVTVPDGNYTATLRAKDHWDNSSTASITVTVDTIAPILDPSSLTPRDWGNTAFSSQPFLVRADDSGSGVDAAASRFTLRDESSGSSSTIPGTSHNVATKWLKTSSVALVAGHVYRLSVDVFDRAGNRTSFAQRPTGPGGGFLATTANPGRGSGRIPATSCSVSPVDLATNTRTVTCPGVRLMFDPTSITLGGSRHPDVGLVKHAVSLGGAKVRGAVGLEETDAYPGQSRSIWLRYELQAASPGPATYAVSGGEVALGTLSLQVPGWWTSSTATLEMGPTQTDPSTAACADPSGSSEAVTCVPDPLLDRYIVVLKDSVGDPDAVANEHTAARGAVVRFVYRSALKGYAAWIPFPEVAAVLADSRVSFVARDRDFWLAADTIPTGVNRINAEGKAAGHRGEGINVAVLDSGIDTANLDLQPRIDRVNRAFDCTGRDNIEDEHGHGTRVAGVIAASLDGQGVVGVAPEIRLWIVKVARGQYPSESTLLCGVEYVHLNSPLLRPQDPIRVANISAWGFATGLLGAEDRGDCGIGNAEPLHIAICAATAAGVTFVAAAGQIEAGEGDPRDFSSLAPATYDEVITVSALADSDGAPCGLGPATADGNADDTLWARSNYAATGRDRAHLVAAPGVDIMTTDRGGGTVTDSGTSFAAPHVSGVVALYIQQRPSPPSPAQVLAALTDPTGGFAELPDVNFGSECSLGVSHRDPSALHPEGVVRADTL